MQYICVCCRFYAAAEAEPDQRNRLNFLAQHILETWLDALNHRLTTGCQPMIVKAGCDDDDQCGGIGDRVFAVQMAFWQVCSDSVSTSDFSICQYLVCMRHCVCIAFRQYSQTQFLC